METKLLVEIRHKHQFLTNTSILSLHMSKDLTKFTGNTNFKEDITASRGSLRYKPINVARGFERLCWHNFWYNLLLQI